jgi:hypothetical protein
MERPYEWRNTRRWMASSERHGSSPPQAHFPNPRRMSGASRTSYPWRSEASSRQSICHPPSHIACGAAQGRLHVRKGCSLFDLWVIGWRRDVRTELRDDVMKSIFVLFALGGAGWCSAAVAAEPEPFSPVPFELTATSPIKTAPVRSGTGGLFVPLAVGPVRIEYGQPIPSGAAGLQRSLLDVPGPGYREQKAKVLGN